MRIWNSKFNLHSLLLRLGVALACLSIGAAQTAREASPEGRAAEILRQASDYLKGLAQFSFRAEVTFDEVLSSGQKLQFEKPLDVYLRRPRNLRAQIGGEAEGRRFWYDGKSLTMLTVEENVYGRIDAPGSIDQALDFAMERFGVAIPLADLLVSDPYESFAGSAKVKSALYAGQSKVRGRRCHHLAFELEYIDFQIWIEDGEKLVPRKILIDYKQVPGRPQYSAVFTRWNLAPRFSDMLFRFTPPRGGEEIEFLPASEEQSQQQ